ncbi:ArpU family transcriptional regulator [Lactobacillus paragasseri]|uniref:ArpU family transcriptional regulator n=1 Tax=Lactobacillus paragasseri TaxID=2107999 RepID=UPI001C6888DC|nr:ArpU family transcriptional regulator [Lactobacillus paragasseri]MBW8451655.1 ArpU family transcriptional regulator [Lactobacillus paragasseri]
MEHENLDFGLSIDMEKTARRAAGFLKYTFPEYVKGAALSLDDLSGQPFTGMPASHSATNSQEKKLERAWNRVEQNELKAVTVYQTIILCQKSPTYPYKQILLNKFVKRLPDWRIQPIVGYSNSQYYLKRRDALCEFAELLEAKKVKNDCFDLPNLIIEPEKSKSDDYRTVSGHLSD